MNEDTIRLGDIATARSGDKGNHANIGVVAFTEAGFEHLIDHLTEQRIAEFLSGLGATGVQRFALPKVQALNFVLYNVLGGGASQSLRIDSQGKLLGTAVLEVQLPKPANLAEMLVPSS